MSKQVIEEFAKLVMENVRDYAIKSADVQLHATNLKSPIAKRWNEKLKDSNKEFAEMLIADSVDQALFYLFEAIDNGALNIIFTSKSGESINLTNDGLGELSGWFMGDWRMKYSNERFFDDAH